MHSLQVANMTYPFKMLEHSKKINGTTPDICHAHADLREQCVTHLS
uniref:Short-chain dehydrogenase n=1 Tax=Rhizophora mucronata TaxID=61149 RepID=A0A2P2K8K0_RHIMU